MKLSVIVPVYNEVSTIREVTRRIKEAGVDWETEIVVVDDASTDGTREVLKEIGGEDITVAFHEGNRGKGAAIRTGLGLASGDVILIQDADLEYDPQDYPRLLEPFQSGAKVVYGSRNLLPSNRRSSWAFYWGAELLNWVTNRLYGANITDMETCYKAFDAKVIKGLNLRANRFEFEPEVTAKVRKAGYEIVEVPISYYPRSFKEGKKISWKDGLLALYTLLKLRFSS